MHFKANLVKIEHHKAHAFILVGIALCFLSIFFWGLPNTQTIAAILSGSGFVMATAAFIVTKGTGTADVDKETLAFDEEGVRIRLIFFYYKDISELHFYFHSFNSMSTTGYFTEHAGTIEYGMYNYISFRRGKLNFKEYFFLADENHSNRFLAFLKDLKAHGIRYTFHYRRGARL